MGNKLIALIELARANLTQTQIGFSRINLRESLLLLSFLCVARKIWRDKFNNILAFFFDVNQTHIV